MKSKRTLRAVQAGETIIGADKKEYTVGPACADKNGGYWFCATHRICFENQLQKDFHIGNPGKHDLVWLCAKHGFEQP